MLTLASLVRPVPWDPLKTKFSPFLRLEGKTWDPASLFPMKPMTEVRVKPSSADAENDHLVFCPGPGREFFYCERVLPAGYSLRTLCPKWSRRGHVAFDSDVVVPTLTEVSPNFGSKVWMGLTPMEQFTQRSGISLARGRVVVGGLGLGWFLSEVCKKKTVKEVIVVDLEARLLDWLRPVLEAKYPHVAAKVKQWVAADVYDFIDADAANHETTKYLLDIWPTFAVGDEKFDAWSRRLPKTGFWGWGQRGRA